MESATAPTAASSPTPPRRSFFRWLAAGLAATAAVVGGGPVIAYFLGTRKSPIDWVNLGRVDEFPLNETRKVNFDNPIRQPWDGIVAHTGVYVRYEGKDDEQRHQFLVLAVNCAHLGCPVSWFPESSLYMCPCHGGAYYADGSRASGPPPRGLFHCEWRVQNNRLEVQAPHYPTLQDTLDNSAESES